MSQKVKPRNELVYKIFRYYGGLEFIQADIEKLLIYLTNRNCDQIIKTRSGLAQEVKSNPVLTVLPVIINKLSAEQKVLAEILKDDFVQYPIACFNLLAHMSRDIPMDVADTEAYYKLSCDDRIIIKRFIKAMEKALNSIINLVYTYAELLLHGKRFEHYMEEFHNKYAEIQLLWKDMYLKYYEID